MRAGLGTTPGSARTLFTHQKKALIYCYITKHPALFMEMRLGKTLVAIRFLKQRYPRGDILVVAPLSVLPVWEEELRKEGTVATWLRGAQRGKPSPGWNLINYESLRVEPSLAEWPWAGVVLDESSKIRNPQAKITQLCVRKFRSVGTRMVLSGLPAPEHLLDFVSHFLFLSGSFLGSTSYWDARIKYFRLVGYEWAPAPGTRDLYLQEVRKRAFCLSRRRAGMGSQKVREPRYVALNAPQRRLQNQCLEDWKTDQQETVYAVTRATWLARVAGGFTPEGAPISKGKAQELLTLLRTELRRDQVVVFFRFNKELSLVWHVLKQAKISCTWMTGKTRPEDRTKRIANFQRGKRRVLLCQVKVVSFGIDLSAASTAIFYSNPWSMEERAQAEDRIEHPLKKEPLLYIDLITKGSVDEDVVEALQEKTAESRQFFSVVVERFKRRKR